MQGVEELLVLEVPLLLDNGKENGNYRVYKDFKRGIWDSKGV